MRPSRALARRLDRLAVRAHQFHRFAHHPLCDRYRDELIAVRGRSRICRGCTYTAAAAISGLTLGAILPPTAAVWSSPVALALLLTLRPTPAPHRASKLLTRFLPALTLTTTTILLLRAQNPFIFVLLAAIAAAVITYRRRGPNRAPCLDCPERAATPCSGFRDIVRAERAFVRRAHRLIDAEARAGSPP